MLFLVLSQLAQDPCDLSGVSDFVYGAFYASSTPSASWSTVHFDGRGLKLLNACFKSVSILMQVLESYEKH